MKSDINVEETIEVYKDVWCSIYSAYVYGTRREEMYLHLRTFWILSFVCLCVKAYYYLLSNAIKRYQVKNKNLQSFWIRQWLI